MTKGIEIRLPESHTFLDKDGIERDSVRVRWWDTEATTYRQVANMSDRQRQALPDIEVPLHARLPFSSEKPIFFGHYWMTGSPALQSPSAVCVDYSAGNGGPLVAYRWEAGKSLSADRFVRAG